MRWRSGLVYLAKPRARMVYSSYVKKRVLYLSRKGKRSPTIARILQREGLAVTRRGIQKFLQRFRTHGTIHRLPGSGRPSKITEEVKSIVEEEMRRDDETTAIQLFHILKEKHHPLSLRTILRCRTRLGWTFRGSAYCQLIRDANKAKRLQWARDNIEIFFDDIVWTDETSVQLESHKRFCCRKKGEPPKSKPRAKHPVKVHIWGGISWQGATSCCIFEGRMNAPLFVSILDKTLLPFLCQRLPEGHRYMQDNDPKHTSRMAASFFEDNGINWWKTPAESPDLNPIENLWHELKEYLRREIKPRTKQELIDGILKFWATITIAKCRKYINHLVKVIPKVIELNGNATGY